MFDVKALIHFTYLMIIERLQYYALLNLPLELKGALFIFFQRDGMLPMSRLLRQTRQRASVQRR